MPTTGNGATAPRSGRRARGSRRHLTATVIAVLVLGTVFLVGNNILRSDDDRGPTPAASAELTPTPTPERDPLEGVQLNALEERRIGELRSFLAWLEANDAVGFVGELGWPKNEQDSESWNTLADKWYALAGHSDLWSTVWAAGSGWSPEYPLTVYTETGGGGLDSANAQAEVLEAHANGSARVGVNLAGLEFGSEGAFSNTDPGEIGVDFFAEPESSFEYLQGRGIDVVRLPFRWERLQSAPLSALAADGVAQLRRALDHAAEHDIDVILDLHNYGYYRADGGDLQVGTDGLPPEALSDLWLKVSDEFRGHEALLAYGLMNEPHSFGQPSGRSAAELWEEVSQQTVDALRSAGDETLIMVAGYDWSSLARWEQTHPDGWITDPADNFRYEAHHYWDADGSGTYPRPYVSELTELPVP